MNHKDVLDLVPHAHEKADICIMLYLRKDAIEEGHNEVSMDTLNTDVVLALTSTSILASLNCGSPLILESVFVFYSLLITR